MLDRMCLVAIQVCWFCKHGSSLCTCVCSGMAFGVKFFDVERQTFFSTSKMQ